jgi:hypothetical protein
LWSPCNISAFKVDSHGRNMAEFTLIGWLNQGTFCIDRVENKALRFLRESNGMAVRNRFSHLYVSETWGRH